MYLSIDILSFGSHSHFSYISPDLSKKAKISTLQFCMLQFVPTEYQITPVQKTEKRPTEKGDRAEDTVEGRWYFRNVLQLDGINYRSVSYLIRILNLR